jgi:F-type H+-transporting ATPase subunit a
MSALAQTPPKRPTGPLAGLRNMRKRNKILLGLAVVYIVGLIAFAVGFGIHRMDNNVFSPIDEFKLNTWAHVAGPLDINKGFAYLAATSILTVLFLWWVSRRMQARPNRVQTAVEWLYSSSMHMSRDNMPEHMARKWFPLVFTLFAFILISNLLGYIPFPVNSDEPFTIAGVDIPSFQLYSVTANLSLPLILTLFVFFAYNIEGFRDHGFTGYLKSIIPRGVEGKILILIAPLEVASHFLRILSLTIRLWANLLAGHLLIAFMAGDLAVLVGIAGIGWLTLPAAIAIYLFEALLIAGLQAFIFAILTAIYLGGATSQTGH